LFSIIPFLVPNSLEVNFLLWKHLSSVGLCLPHQYPQVDWIFTSACSFFPLKTERVLMRKEDLPCSPGVRAA
jgi:hypothetical protein